MTNSQDNFRFYLVMSVTLIPMEYLRDLVMKVIKCATRSVKPMACFLPQYRNDLLIGYILNYFVPADIDSEYTYFL